MFHRLTDFGHQRSPIQALGFYLVYFALGLVVSMGLAALAGMIFSGVGVDEGLTIGAAVAIVGTTALSFSVLYAKGLLGHVGYLLVAVLSVAGAVAAGLLLGLVFVAFLTTRPSARTAEPVEVGPTFA